MKWKYWRTDVLWKSWLVGFQLVERLGEPAMFLNIGPVQVCFFKGKN